MSPPPISHWRSFLGRQEITFVNEAMADSDDQEEDAQWVDYRGATERDAPAEATDISRRLYEDDEALTAPDSAAAALTPRRKAQLASAAAAEARRETTGEGETTG